MDYCHHTSQSQRRLKRLFDLLHTPVQCYQQHLSYIGLFLLQSCMFLPVLLQKNSPTVKAKLDHMRILEQEMEVVQGKKNR